MENNHLKTVIIIAGPTAAGKTAIAVQLAQHFKTEIISADSRQCYKELNIGVAKPSAFDLSVVKHHFISSHSIQEKVNAAVFEKYALDSVADIFNNRNVAIMVGGTGLYIKAFTEGIDEIPEVPAELHQRIIDEYTKNGLPWLQQQVQLKDSIFFSQGEMQNPHRLMRALEVREHTGKSITTFRKRKTVQRPFNIVKVGLEVPKEVLHQHINNRVEQMIGAGLVEEVRSLMPFQQLNALQTVGYRELFEHLSGKTSLNEAVKLIKQNTRQYAKRQMTWFKKDTDIEWVQPSITAVSSLAGICRL